MSVLTFVTLRFFRRAHRFFRKTRRLLLYLDGLAAAMFSVQAASMLIAQGYGGTVAVMMGVIAAMGGGLIRDVLAGRPNLLMTRELYASLLLLGCIFLVALQTLLPAWQPGAYLALALIFLLRAAAIRWSIVMPDWLTVSPER